VIGRALAAARRGAGHLAGSRRLAAKLARVWQRRRGAAAYRERLAAGELLLVPQAPPAEVLFTVAVPVYRVAEEHLRAAIASVRAQTHAGWQLVLVDDASPDPHVGHVLAEVARGDARVAVVRRAVNGGIAAASDDALRAARGDFVAFLDHDDVLHPRALEVAARTLSLRPEADWLFSDEDKLDERGRHSEPCLKPGWSRHLLHSFNYAAHLRIVRRALLARLGGHRAGFDGAQDYDLALRAVAAGARFVHVPGVLYHWRAVAGSMARLAQEKPRAHARAVAALAEHARGWPRGGEVSCRVLLAPASMFRLRRAAAAGLRVCAVAGGAIAAAVETARQVDADVVVSPPAIGWPPGALEELLALLQVPGTAVAVARGVARGRVASSGWAVDAVVGAFDPWSGLAAADPGYLNLALVPGPRALPGGAGWAAWRDDLVAAWEAASDAADPWRLAVGTSRLALETVVSPEVSTQCPAAPPQPAPPAGIPLYRTRWAAELGLL
jgi:hypothetical protein